MVCTNTGMKHLHQATTKFELMICFEANGHDIVAFSEVAIKRILKYEPKSPAQSAALETPRALADLINQAVGDALSDLLLMDLTTQFPQASNHPGQRRSQAAYLQSLGDHRPPQECTLPPPSTG